MYPLSFPLGHLAGAQPGDWVLDPFCGRGTTAFAARLLGLSSANIDVSPVATAIAATKLVSVTPDDIVREAESILATEPLPQRIPSGPFWELAFHPSTLQDICRLRQGLLRTWPAPADGHSWHLAAGTLPGWPGCTEPPARTALRALLLGVLHGPKSRGAPSYLSNQMPRTYATKPEAAVRFWHRNGLLPHYVDVLDLVARRARYILAELPRPVQGVVVQGDSRSPTLFQALQERLPPFRWVITSPPYYGMRFYLSDQWLRYWFLGGPDWVEYRTEGQMGSQPLEAYLQQLGRVWRLVATVCSPGARLVVRFGSIPSLTRGEPAELVCASLRYAADAWRVVSVQGAGRPPHQRRQAEQFVRPGRGPEEVDVVAVRL